MSDAKKAMFDIAAQMEASAMLLLGKGLSQLKRASKMTQLADFMSDNAAETCLANLIADGLVILNEKGEAFLVPEEDEFELLVAELDELQMTGKGGDA